MEGPMFLTIEHDGTKKFINVEHIAHYNRHHIEPNRTIITMMNKDRFFIEEDIDEFTNRIYGLWLDNKQMALTM